MIENREKYGRPLYEVSPEIYCIGQKKTPTLNLMDNDAYEKVKS